jgi:hypothetical protein
VDTTVSSGIARRAAIGQLVPPLDFCNKDMEDEKSGDVPVNRCKMTLP